MTKYPERNQEIDVVRGIAILLVMLGHAIQCSNGMRPTHPLQQLIMTFWMPLFFLISGYAHGMPGGGRLSRKVRRLLVPYFLWASVVYGCNVWMGRTELGFVEGANGLLHSGFWFLRMLFEIWLVSYVFHVVWMRFGWILGGVGSMVVLGFEYFIIGEQSVFHYLPLYVIGIILYFLQRYIPKKND